MTGASSGIGRAFAERLASEGRDVVLVARRGDQLEAQARQLETLWGVHADVLVADLTISDQLAEVEQRLREDAAVALLVNDAGMGGYGPFAEVALRTIDEVLRLNVVAPTRLARAVLPGMLRRGTGVIVNVSSLLAFRAARPPGPGREVYIATKAYLLALTQALAMDVRGSGVRIQALCPRIVASEFHLREGEPGPRPGAMSAEDVVSASLRGLELGETICTPTVEDAALVRTVSEAGLVFFDEASGPALATRYASRHGS